MTVSKVKGNAKNRLIVEGRDDQWAIIALTGRHGWDWNRPEDHFPFVHDAQGIDGALEAFPVAVTAYQSVGIVIDADDEPAHRWSSVRARAAAVGIAMPDEPDRDGTIIDAGKRRVGVWLMPDNSRAGKLEDFISLLVPPDDSVWPVAIRAASDATVAGAPFRPVDSSKAEIHTWLAWQEVPGQPFGTAITAAALRHDTSSALRFVQWFGRLFAPAT